MLAPGQCPWWRPHPSRDISSWKRIVVADLNPWNCGCEDSRYLSCQVQRWPGFKKPTYWLQGRHSITYPCIILYPCLHSYYIHISYHHIIIISLNILSGSLQLGWSLSKTPFGTAQLALWVLSPEQSWRRDLLSQAFDSENIFANHMSSKGGLTKFSPVKSSIPFSKGVRCKSWYKRPQHLHIETWRCNLTSSHPLFSAKPEASCKSRPWHLSRRTSCHGNFVSRTSRKTVKLLLCCKANARSVYILVFVNTSS